MVFVVDVSFPQGEEVTKLVPSVVIDKYLEEGMEWEVTPVCFEMF